MTPRALIPVFRNCLALGTAKRSPGLPAVPTFREQGFDIVMEDWTI